MDHQMPNAPMEPFLDVERFLDPICQCCALPFFQCMTAIPSSPYTAARAYFRTPTTYQPPLTEAELAPLIAYVNEGNGHNASMQPLVNENVGFFDTNETTVQPATVQAHIEEIYTPGDRLGLKAPKIPHKRQVPRVGGYPCKSNGCGKVFNRACELNRHRKHHLGRSERPHQCNICHEGFLYPKDLHRHQKKHAEQRSAQDIFHCEFPGCSNVEGFSRHDNLLRHQRKQHGPAAGA